LKHLKKFGQHCIMHTEGAKLVLNIEDEIKVENEAFVNSKIGDGLNDCEDTELLKVS
jgi:hypothetical protein